MRCALSVGLLGRMCRHNSMMIGDDDDDGIWVVEEALV